MSITTARHRPRPDEMNRQPGIELSVVQLHSWGSQLVQSVEIVQWVGELGCPVQWCAMALAMCNGSARQC